ncbi:MAG: hypothetical protein KME32_09160 [Mojavia pulchra JT2-VF2]|uniref:Uncharacterized protein n=1 Tax=Mojavia pulchra JT2-VF2 TaxID=287848 RepID=A0A951PXZ7_9NOST|nr:hypothetical protein [Mojavia pulchra JT2-VF2]
MLLEQDAHTSKATLRGFWQGDSRSETVECSHSSLRAAAIAVKNRDEYLRA